MIVHLQRLGAQTLAEAAHSSPWQGPFRLEGDRLPPPPNFQGDVTFPLQCQR